MASVLRAFVLLIFALVAMPASAQAPIDVTGWWRADVAHNGEIEPFYMHFDRNAEGAPRMRFTVPVARMNEVAGGGYEVAGEELKLPAFGLTFRFAENGGAFEGTMPPGFIASVPVQVRFVRAGPPPPSPPAPTPRGEAPAPAWTVSVGAPVWAGLVLEPRRALYVAAADGSVSALSQRDGAQIWRVELGTPIHATPTLRNRRLYVATDAALVVLDARNGREIWRAAFGAEREPRLPISTQGSKFDHYSSSAVVDDRLTVVGSRDGCVYALDTRTGAQRWRNCTEAIITATPLLTRDAVYYASFDHNVYAVSRDSGAELWRFDAHEAVPRDLVLAGENVLAGSRSYDLFALNARTGERSWSSFIWYSWIDAPPVVAGGRIYQGTSDAVSVFAFDATTGARIWASPVPGWTWPGVVVSETRLYAPIVGGRYSAPRVGGLAAIDRATGALLWLRESEPAPEGALYGFASAPVVSGTSNRFFAADLQGQVMAFDDAAR